MTSKASKKKKELVEEVVEEIIEKEEVVEEEPVVEDMPRGWNTKIWRRNLPLAIDEHIGSFIYYESTNELAVEEVLNSRYRRDMEILLIEVNVSTLSDGSELQLMPTVNPSHFIKNLHLAGVLYSKLYANEAKSFYEVE